MMGKTNKLDNKKEGIIYRALGGDPETPHPQYPDGRL